ncbi:MAG: hypothetical protein NTU51_10215 [Bacteroidetes bacterium]|nr:hypothetical protein [Bacteroidota bacterium]
MTVRFSRPMALGKTFFITGILALFVVMASCSKNSYYYREKETKTRDCAQPATTSHKYKK